MNTSLQTNWWATGIGALSGAGYGLASYAWFEHSGGVMVLSFLLLVPFALGVIAGALTARREGFGQAVLRTLLALVAFAGVALALDWEGLICLVFGLPLMSAAALLGAGLAFVIRPAAGRGSCVVLSLALPFSLAPFERAQPRPHEYRTTESSIVIEASPHSVWQQIRSVPHIRPEEFHPSWSHLISLPRPDAAVLNHDGVGGIRTATFQGGLSFYETVTGWEPGSRLAFRIQARDPGQLDPHVRVGGETFDVVSGRYDIEVLGPRKVLLHLTSTQRVSTHLNAYVGWCVNLVMSDLQQAILRVIQERSETPPGTV